MNLKISYSCMNNMERIISSHNSKILRDLQDNLRQNQDTTRMEKSTCNCRTGSECPVEGICMAENTIYEATIFPKEKVEEKKIYIGISAGDWKHRLYNHRQSFKNKCKKSQTALSLLVFVGEWPNTTNKVENNIKSQNSPKLQRQMQLMFEGENLHNQT